MRTPDSRSRSGTGIIPLRHEDWQASPGYADVSQVIGQLGKNVKGRREAPSLGHYRDVAETIGNIMPHLCIHKDTRSAPGHAPVWPVVVGDGLVAPAGSPGFTITPSGGATRMRGGSLNESATQLVFAPPPRAGTTVALPSGASFDGTPNTMRPVTNETMDPDKRFQSAPFVTPMEGGYKLWPRFPEGYYGVALPATNEERQVNIFLPCDPRLIAVNFDDDPAYGSLVCDMDGDGGIDVERMARLQSALRVVVRPRSSILTFPDANALAFQLNASGNGDTMGGLFFDVLRGNIMGHAAVQAGGPFDVGTGGDRHRLGEDEDGNQINSLHLSLSTLFLDRNNSDIDGPMFHEGYAQGAVEAPHRTRCHFVFNPRRQYMWLPGRASIGMQEWESTSFLYVPNTPTGGPPPTTTPPPTGGPPTGSPPVNTPGGGNNPLPKPPTAGDGPSVPSGGAIDDPTRGGGVPVPKDGGLPKGPDIRDLQGGMYFPPVGGPSPNGPSPAPPPAQQPGNNGAGVVPVGVLPGGVFPGWNPNPFGGIFGFGGGRHNKHWAQQQAARKARRDARKAKHKKGGVFGVKFVPPAPPGPGVPRGKFPGGKPHGFDPKFKGFPPDAGKDFFGRIAPPAPPNVFTPGGGPGPVGAGPTPSSGPGSVLGPPAPARGPMPTGSFPVPVLPPAMTNEIMLPSILARPQHYSRLAPDLRYALSPDPHSVKQHDRTAPVTGHIVAYGAQGGAVGGSPGSTQPNYWRYSEKPRVGKFWAGTAIGGFVFMSPRMEMADFPNVPAAALASPSYFAFAPGTYMAWGKPDTANGGIYSGWRAGANTSGTVTFEQIDSTGAVVDSFTLPPEGNESGVIKSAPQSIDNSGGTGTTLVDVTTLTNTIAANENQKFKFYLTLGSALTTTGAKFAVTCPAGGTIAVRAFLIDSGGNSLAGVATSSGSAITFNAGSFAGVSAVLEIEGNVQNGSTAGSIQLQFAQSSGSLNPLTIAAGADGNFTKV